MKEPVVDASGATWTTLPLLLLLSLFFLGLGGWILYDARRRWKSGVMTGTHADPLYADRTKNPGVFAFLGGVRGFAGIALFGFGLMLLALAMLYGFGMILSAITGVPL